MPANRIPAERLGSSARWPAATGPSRSEAIAEQAAAWIVGLTADDEAERERAHTEFGAWKSANPCHAEVAARMENFIGQALSVREKSRAIDARPVRAALKAAFSINRD